jgi:site-specific DNA-methyltransferase (adenine-specific)
MTDLATNVLYYGDNLDILRRCSPDAAVDHVYLDPPRHGGQREWMSN